MIVERARKSKKLLLPLICETPLTRSFTVTPGGFKDHKGVGIVWQWRDVSSICAPESPSIEGIEGYGVEVGWPELVQFS